MRRKIKIIARLLELLKMYRLTLIRHCGLDQQPQPAGQVRRSQSPNAQEIPRDPESISGRNDESIVIYT